MDHASRSRRASTGSERPTERDAKQASLDILRIASDIYPEVVGGGAIHAHAMSRKQASDGHDVTVITSDHGNRSKPRREERDGYTVHRLKEIARPAGNSITPGVLGALRRRVSEADIVHAHSHLYFTTNVGALLARFSDTPLVLTNHGLVSKTAPGWLSRIYLPTVGRFTFNAADCVLCYTETDRRRLREHDVTAPIEIVENGIDCERFTPPTGERENAILFVGRLVDRKGVATLIDAFAALLDTHSRLELRIVGDGPDRAAYEQRCRNHGVEDSVRFLGELDYDRVVDQYRESRAFVLPSSNEGLPRTVLEALACETPVVTTALPQLESLVDDAGFTVEDGSTAGFVDAIDDLLTDDALRARMGRVGRQRVLETHAWSDTVDATTDVYYDLLK